MYWVIRSLKSGRAGAPYAGGSFHRVVAAPGSLPLPLTAGYRTTFLIKRYHYRLSRQLIPEDYPLEVDEVYSKFLDGVRRNSVGVCKDNPLLVNWDYPVVGEHFILDQG